MLGNLQLGACGILFKCLSDRVIHAFKHRLFVGELDLQLGRMHVDVHAHRVEPDKQDAARELFGRAIRGERLLQRSACRFALDITGIDKEILIVAVGAHAVGATYVALDRYAVKIPVDLDESGCEILSEYRPDRALQASIPCRFQLDVSVHDQAESNLGMRERKLFHVGGHSHCLGHVSLEEFATRRHVGKQILGNHGGAHSTAALGDIHDLTAVHVHLRTQRRIRCFG